VEDVNVVSDADCMNACLQHDACDSIYQSSLVQHSSSHYNTGNTGTAAATTTTTGHDVCDSMNYRSSDWSCELNTHPDSGPNPVDIVDDDQWVHREITPDLVY